MAHMITVRANPNNAKKEKMIMRVPYPLSLVPDGSGGYRGLPKKDVSKFPGAINNGRVIVNINHGMSFDKESDVGKLTLGALLAYPEVVAKDKKSIDGRQRYYLEDLKAQAIVNVSHDQQVFEVGAMIFAMTSTEREKIYEAGYGLNADLVSPSQISEHLIKKVKDNPALVRSKIKDPDLDSRFFISELVKYGIFRKEGNKIYHGVDHNSKLIGLDVAHVVKWMSESDNTDYIDQLTKDLSAKKNPK